MRVNERYAALLAGALVLGSLIFWQPAFLAHGQRSNDAASQQTAQSGGNTDFRPVEGPAREEIPGGVMLVAAYGLVWLLLLLYVARTALLQSRAQQELDRLERRLNKVQASGETGGA